MKLPYVKFLRVTLLAIVFLYLSIYLFRLSSGLLLNSALMDYEDKYLGISFLIAKIMYAIIYLAGLVLCLVLAIRRSKLTAKLVGCLVIANIMFSVLIYYWFIFADSPQLTDETRTNVIRFVAGERTKDNLFSMIGLSVDTVTHELAKNAYRLNFYNALILAGIALILVFLYEKLGKSTSKDLP